MPITPSQALALAVIREREPTMKVGQTSDSQRTSPLGSVLDGRAPAPASAAPVEPVEAGDRVELSAASRSLVAGGTEPAAGAVREWKVEEVRRAIQEGRFHVSAHAVADRMIAEAAELVETIARGASR
jgi:negative regulator of flagellin synthesis FlgM